MFPPVSLGVQVLRFLESQKCKGLFIIPLRPTSVWFNVFTPNFKMNVNSPSCFAEIVTFSCAAMHFDFSKTKMGERVVISRVLCLLGGCDLC